MSEIVNFVEKFCESVGIPFKAKCRHCKEIHTAQSYTITDAADDEDDEWDGMPEMWFSIDYGRCEAMKTERHCFRTCAPVAADKRQEMRDLFRALVGDQP